MSDVQPFTDYGDECVDATSARAAAKPLVFIWGDSHAARVYAGMNQVHGARYRLAQFTRDGCPPLIGSDAGRCLQGDLLILRKIQQTKPNIVVLFAAWSGYSPDWGIESAGRAVYNLTSKRPTPEFQ